MNKKFIDYYEILEVNRNASQNTINKIYKILAKQYHPDLNNGISEHMKLINEAYETLGNETKREAYNKLYDLKKDLYKKEQYEDRNTSSYNSYKDSNYSCNTIKNHKKIDKITISHIYQLILLVILIVSFKYGKEIGLIPISYVLGILFIIYINKHTKGNVSKIYYIFVVVCIVNLIFNINEHSGVLYLTTHYYLNYRF